MALIGSIEAFTPRQTDIMSYMERIDLLFACNDIPNTKKVSLFLTLLGGEAYNVLKDLVAPLSPSTLTFERLRTELENYYSPKRLIIAERYRFYSATQEISEDVKTFVARLKNLAKHCAFGTFLHDALRDKLVCGIRSENVQRKLLTEENLTFERAFQLAISMEMAENQIKIMGNDTTSIIKVSFVKNNIRKPSSSSSPYRTASNQYNSTSKSDSPTGKFNCKRCLRLHRSKECPAINWKCFACNQRGHIAKSSLCKNKIHDLTEDDTTQDEIHADVLDSSGIGWLSEPDEQYFLNALVRPKDNGSLRIKLPVEDSLLVMEVNSGACKSVIYIDDYKKWFPNVRLEPVTFQLRVVTGESVNIVGQITVSVKYEKKVFVLPLVVLNSKPRFTPPLGRNWLNIFHPHWKTVVDTNVIFEESNMNSVHKMTNVNELIADVKTKFPGVFLNEPNSTIRHFKADIKLKDNAKSLFHRAYSMPYALQSKVEEEVSKMVESGVLTKVTHSAWASPIVVVPKKNCTDIRICVDFKKTLNSVIDSDHCVLPLPEDVLAEARFSV